MEKHVILKTAIADFLIVLLVAPIIAIAMSLPTMWAWNHVITYLFGLPEIAWTHAFALNYLAGIFIKANPSVSSK